MSDKVMLILQKQIDELKSELQKRIDMNEGFLELIADLKAQIPQWLPIDENAPRDKAILLTGCYSNKGCWIGKYKTQFVGTKREKSGWGEYYGTSFFPKTPTHYQLLPTPPESEA